ncbi:MAG: AbrB family transcriptional regulator [Granulosicoccus sp.]|nr:AbrB family transcriptional regulator [Granulosicoccus sp.]
MLIRNRLETLLWAAAGVVVFSALHIPLAFLFGPLFFCLAAALAKRPLQGMGQVSVAARTILGVAVGASITPDVLSQLPAMAGSLVMIPLYIVTIAVIGVPFFHRVCGFDRTTAYYAAMPGGLQDMVIFGAEAGADIRALSLIHATRVLVIVTIVPIILTIGFGLSLNAPMGEPLTSLPVTQLLLMLVAAVIGWKGGERIGLFGASILGPMMVTAILSLTGLIHYRPPAEAILLAQYLIGIGIGVGYVGISLAELKRDVLAGVAFVFILAALALAFTEIVVLTGAARPLEGFLAFAPGGQAEMTVLAIVASADLGFVIVHHLTRIFLVITCAPVAMRLLVKHRDN